MFIGLGLCYAALQDLESALFWFEKAFTLHPGLLLVSSLSSAHLSLLICSICLNDEELGPVFVRRWLGGWVSDGCYSDWHCKILTYLHLCDLKIELSS